MDMKVLTTLYDSGVAKKSEACPTDLQSRFHTIQARYRDHQCIFTDGPKHDNKVGRAVVYDGRFLGERLRETASGYTEEPRAIFSAVHRAFYSKRDKFVECVDSRSCLQAIDGLHIEHPVVLEIVSIVCTPRAR